MYRRSDPLALILFELSFPRRYNDIGSVFKGYAQPYVRGSIYRNWVYVYCCPFIDSNYCSLPNVSRLQSPKQSRLGGTLTMGPLTWRVEQGFWGMRFIL